MAQHHTHGGHDHRHKSGCGHKEVQHGDHTDYLHDGHLHHVHGDHVDECTLVAGGTNPAACTPGHACGAHDKTHAHRSDCGTRLSRTPTTPTTWWRGTCITRTARTVTITVR
jgi:hypothetical protein